MAFLHNRLLKEVSGDLATARQISVTTWALELDMLIRLAEKAPQAQIRVMFSSKPGARWNYEDWIAFRDKLGHRVQIHVNDHNQAPDLHAKVLRVSGDFEFAVVGSSNLTKNGYGMDGSANTEASMRVGTEPELKRIDQWLVKLWNSTGDYGHPQDDVNLALINCAQPNQPKEQDEASSNPDETLPTTAGDNLEAFLSRLRLGSPRDRFRDYQDEILSKLEEHRPEGTFQELIVLPVGAGKTLIAAEFIKRRLVESTPPFRIAWVAHTLELAEQAVSAVLSQLDTQRKVFRTIIWVGEAKSKHVVDTLRKEESFIAFTTVQSLRQLRKKLPRGSTKFDLIVVDEAHHYADGGQWRTRILEACQSKGLLGLTATPDRLDGEELPFERTHGESITFRQLVERELLAQPRYEAVPTKGLITGLRRPGKRDINYFEREGIKEFDRDGRNRFIAEDLAKRNNLGPTLVFCATTDHADHLGEELKKVGLTKQVHSIHSKHSLEQRGEALRWFRSAGSSTRILLNCKLYIEGFDMADIRTIVMARPTLSPTYWVQMIGRGVRKTQTHPSFTIIEYTDNYEEPRWDALRASFYLLHDRGLVWWRSLYEGEILEEGGKQIDHWNRQTQKLYSTALRASAQRPAAA